MMQANGYAWGLIEGVRRRRWVARLRQWLSRQHVILGLAALVAVLLILANELNLQAAGEASKDNGIIAQRQSAIYDLQRLLLDAETGQRGYLLTGDPAYLQPYNQALVKMEGSLNSLRALVMANARLTAEFSALSRAISRKLAELELTITLRQSGAESEPWQSVMNTGLGQQYMQAVREASDALLNSAADDLALQTTRVQQSLRTSRVSLLISAIFGLLAFALYLRGSTKLQEATQKRAQDLQQEKAKLEGLVLLRTAELERLANHLINVQERERERLARELHDELGSLLTAAKFDVARIKSRLQGETAELQERLSHLTSTLNAGIAVKRKIIENLRPSALVNLGLPAALEILTQEFSANTQVPVDISVDDVALNEDQQLAVYRLVQEAFTNVAKHAQAKRAQVLVKNYLNHIEVVVSDDGVGFDPGQSKVASHGLSGMRQRMHALQGALELKSRVGQGTSITGILPLRPEPQSEASPPLASWIQPGT
jgi:signal transduction histidine kinase